MSKSQLNNLRFNKQTFQDIQTLKLQLQDKGLLFCCLIFNSFTFLLKKRKETYIQKLCIKLKRCEKNKANIFCVFKCFSFHEHLKTKKQIYSNNCVNLDTNSKLSVLFFIPRVIFQPVRAVTLACVLIEVLIFI